jgi:integrase
MRPLRVKDVDFDCYEILVRDGKSGKDRVTMLPVLVVAPLKLHLQQRQALFEDDKRNVKAEVYLPDALTRKYPNVGLAT